MLNDNIETSKENITPKSPQFLMGGGEMGELIRSYDWSKTALGSPETWSQSLRIAVRIMLDCPFGMCITWGNDYIQLYNDGFRPILGTTKHPQALGISSPETFPEIWITIEPMFEGVMQGTPVGFPDFTLQLNRNGYLEECVFDFSHSPIRLENGEVGGILTTVIETTEKVKALKALQGSESRFQNLIHQSNIAIIVLTGEEMRVEIVNEAYGRLLELTPDDLLGKKMFDVVPDAEAYFRPIMDKVRVTGESLQLYDQPYSIVVYGKRIEGYVNTTYQPYKNSDGTIIGVSSICQDVTETIKNRQKIEENEEEIKKIASNLTLATDSANVGTWSLDVKTEHLEWSDLHKRMWGYDEYRTDLVYEDWYKIIVEEDKALAFERVEKARINHSFYEVDYRIKRANDGALRYMRAVGRYHYNDEGEAERLTGVSIDITESKQLEDSVRENEKKIRNFILQAPVAMSLYRGPKYIIEIVNDELLAIWDKSLDAVINKPVFEAMPEAKNQGFEALLDKVYTTGEKFEAFGISIELIRNGKPKTIYVNLVYQAYREVDGTISGIVEVVSEVTEQVTATKQIEASEKRFSNILTQSLMGITILKGPEMIVTFANEPIIAIWGKGGDVFGKPLMEVLPELKNQPFSKLLNKVYTTGVPLSTNETLCIINRNGKEEECYFNLVYQPYREVDDSITGVTGILVEVTEQVLAKKQIEASENQFRIFADSIQNLAWIADADGWIHWYNQRWYEYTGTTFEEMQGWGWDKVHHPDHIEKVVAFVKEAWKKDEAWELTFPLRKHNGEYRWFLTRAYPVKDANGKIERWIGTNTDFTEQKISTEELEKQVLERTKELQTKNIELENTNAELASFSYIASHDLQEPLRKIQTFSNRIVETEVFSSQTQHYFSRIVAASDRMRNLIASLLDYSRTNTTELILKSCDLNTILEESVNDLDQRILENRQLLSMRGFQ